jgi:hypothetical protein
MECDRCGKELKDSIYIGDFLPFEITGKEGIDLCEDCHKEIINIIQNWWKEESDV